MLEIAGGIIIAVIVLCALGAILYGAMFLLSQSEHPARNFLILLAICFGIAYTIYSTLWVSFDRPHFLVRDTAASAIMSSARFQSEKLRPQFRPPATTSKSIQRRETHSKE
jgi:hypothetical protein